MFNLSIVMGDSDNNYLKRLSKYLMLCHHYNFSVQNFSKVSHLITYLEHNTVDILLITELFYKKLGDKPIQGVVIMLVDTCATQKVEEHPYIHKYQSGKKIVASIVRHYSNYSTKETKNLAQSGVQVVGIYSPSGGCGKTTLTMALAKVSAIVTENTLLLNMEHFESFQWKESIAKGQLTTMSDLIYYIKKEVTNINVKLEGIVSIDEETNLHYVQSVAYPEDIEELTGKEVKWFIDYIKDYGWYKKIYINIPSDYSNRNKAIMEICDQLLLVCNDSGTSQYKTLKFIKQLSEEVINDKLCIVKNHSMANNEQYEYNTEETLKVDWEIPYYKGLLEKKIVSLKQLTDNPYDTAMKELHNRLFTEQNES